MLTTFDDEEYIIRSLQAGAVGYLMKDMPPEDLAGAVRQAYNGVYQMSDSIMISLIDRLATVQKQGLSISTLPEHIAESIAGLSSREKEVFSAIGKGYTNHEIAESLYLSEGTIKNYVSSILNTIGLRDRVQAALIAQQWEELQDQQGICRKH